DDWWLAKSGSANPIATYNYTWNTGNEFRADLGVLTIDNLRDIGIYVVLTGLTWPEYLNRLFVNPNRLGLYMIGWGPDYNDPSNFINPLFSPTSSSNGAQVDDAELNTMMGDGLTETDPVARRQLYYDIQARIVEVLMPWVFLYVPVSRGVRSVTVDGILRNPMGKLWFASMYWVPVDAPVADDDDDDDDDGDDDTTTGIPGYSFIGLVGAAAIGLGLIYKKRK
ncbi:MAG: ABC transporter substrate-binding protein, partial [Promethearchaeota archaeon]